MPCPITAHSLKLSKQRNKMIARRLFTTTVRRLNTTSNAGPVVQPAVVVPKRKIGAFRGGFFGFLVGTVLTGAGAYYYVFDEYKTANSVVIADVLRLQQSINNLENHVNQLESKVSK